MSVDQQAFKVLPGLGNVNVDLDLSKDFAQIDSDLDAWAANENAGANSATPPKKSFLDVFNTVLTTGNTALQTYQNHRGGGGSAPAPAPQPSVPWVPIAIGGGALVAVALLLKSNKK